MASYFGRQQSVASMASLPADEVEFELDLEVECMHMFFYRFTKSVNVSLTSPTKDKKKSCIVVLLEYLANGRHLRTPVRNI